MTPIASLAAAGRTLDREIAFRVFGHGVTHPPQSSPGYWIEWNGEPERSGSSAKPLPEYSTDIAAAWEVVDKMLETHSVDVNAIPGESNIQWGATMQKMPFVARYPEHGACAKTAPLAICLAALEAVAALKAVAP